MIRCSRAVITVNWSGLELGYYAHTIPEMQPFECIAMHTTSYILDLMSWKRKIITP